MVRDGAASPPSEDNVSEMIEEMDRILNAIRERDSRRERLLSLKQEANYDSEAEISARTKLSQEGIRQLRDIYESLKTPIDVRPLARIDGTYGNTTTGLRILISAPERIEDFFNTEIGQGINAEETGFMRSYYESLIELTRHQELLIYARNSEKLLRPILLKPNEEKSQAYIAALKTRCGEIADRHLLAVLHEVNIAISYEQD